MTTTLQPTKPHVDRVTDGGRATAVVSWSGDHVTLHEALATAEDENLNWTHAHCSVWGNRLAVHGIIEPVNELETGWELKLQEKLASKVRPRNRIDRVMNKIDRVRLPRSANLKLLIDSVDKLGTLRCVGEIIERQHGRVSSVVGDTWIDRDPLTDNVVKRLGLALTLRVPPERVTALWGEIEQTANNPRWVWNVSLESRRDPSVRWTNQRPCDAASNSSA